MSLTNGNSVFARHKIGLACDILSVSSCAVYKCILLVYNISDLLDTARLCCTDVSQCGSITYNYLAVMTV